MNVRLVRFSFGPGKGAEARALATELGPLIKSQPGCQDVTFFGDDGDGEYGIYVLWASPAEADAAAEIVGPRLQGHLAGNAQGPADARLFEVISD